MHLFLLLQKIPRSVSTASHAELRRSRPRIAAPHGDVCARVRWDSPSLPFLPKHVPIGCEAVLNELLPEHGAVSKVACEASGKTPPEVSALAFYSLMKMFVVSHVSSELSNPPVLPTLHISKSFHLSSSGSQCYHFYLCLLSRCSKATYKRLSLVAKNLLNSDPSCFFEKEWAKDSPPMRRVFSLRPWMEFRLSS